MDCLHRHRPLRTRSLLALQEQGKAQPACSCEALPLGPPGAMQDLSEVESPGQDLPVRRTLDMEGAAASAPETHAPASATTTRVLEAQAANIIKMEENQKISDEDRRLINRYLDVADPSMVGELLKRASQSFAARGSPVKAPSAHACVYI